MTSLMQKKLTSLLFIRIICIDSRFDMFHQSIIVILVIIPPSIGSSTILPFLSTNIVVGNAIISDAYFPASEVESMERLRYLAPWLSRMDAASLMAVLFPSKVSVLMPTTSPPIDLMASFNSLSLDNSATQGLQPVNQKLTTVTAFLENRLSSTELPS